MTLAAAMDSLFAAAMEPCAAADDPATAPTGLHDNRPLKPTPTPSSYTHLETHSLPRANSWVVELNSKTSSSRETPEEIRLARFIKRKQVEDVECLPKSWYLRLLATCTESEAKEIWRKVLDSVKHSGSRAKKKGAPFYRPDALRRALRYQLDSKTMQLNQELEQAGMPLPPDMSCMYPRAFVMITSESFYGGGGGGVTSFDGGEIAALELEREEARQRGDHGLEQHRHVQLQQAQQRADEHARQARRMTAQETLWRAQALQAEHQHQWRAQALQAEHQQQQQRQWQYQYAPQYGHPDHRANQARYYHQHQQIQQIAPPHPGYYTAGAHQMMPPPFMASQGYYGGQAGPGARSMVQPHAYQQHAYQPHAYQPHAYQQHAFQQHHPSHGHRPRYDHHPHPLSSQQPSLQPPLKYPRTSSHVNEAPVLPVVPPAPTETQLPPQMRAPPSAFLENGDPGYGEGHGRGFVGTQAQTVVKVEETAPASALAPAPALVPKAAPGAPVRPQALPSAVPLAPPPTSALPSPALPGAAPPSLYEYVPTSPTHTPPYGAPEPPPPPPPPPPIGHGQAEKLRKA